MDLLAVMSSGSGFPLIASAGVAIYISSKSAVDALVGAQPATAGRMALGHWVPIAVLAIAAMWTDRQQIAMGVVFASAVACLSLAMGAVIFLSPPLAVPAARRCWMMLLPAGLLAFLAGFGGRISGLDAGVLLLQGLFVLWLWIEPARPQSPAPVIAMETEPPKPIRALLLRILQLLLAITLAAVGAWLAMAGIDSAIATSDLASAGLLTAMMLCPLLVLPIIGTGTELAQRNQSAAAVSAQVGVSLLNVFALLPLLVLIGHRHELFSAVQQRMIAVFHFTSHVSQPVDPVVIFPLAVWRVDVVMIIALGLYLLPIAIGKWKMTKLQGAALMLGYAVYLVLSLGIAVQKE